MLPLQDVAPTITPIPLPGLPQAAPQVQALPATPTPPLIITAAPVPGAPTPVPVTGPTGATIASVADQPNSAAALLALVIYLAVFGVLGYRRGWQRELTVLAVSLGLFFILQRYSDQIVALFDKFGKGWAFILGQPIPQQSGLGAWAAANEATLMIVLWLLIVVFTYVLTGQMFKKSKKDGWGFLTGVLNGLVIATVFAPLLTGLIYPNSTVQGPIIELSLPTFLGNIWAALTGFVARVWTVIQPYGAQVLFLGVVLLVLLAAFTLRTSPRKAKS